MDHLARDSAGGGGVTRAVLKIALLECRTRYIKWLTHITKLEPVAINQRSGFQSNDEGKSPKTELVSNVETDLNTDLRVLCFVFCFFPLGQAVGKPQKRPYFPQNKDTRRDKSFKISSSKSA